MVSFSDQTGLLEQRTDQTPKKKDDYVGYNEHKLRKITWKHIGSDSKMKWSVSVDFLVTDWRNTDVDSCEVEEISVDLCEDGWQIVVDLLGDSHIEENVDTWKGEIVEES